MHLASPQRRVALCGFDPSCKTLALDPRVHRLWGGLRVTRSSRGDEPTKPMVAAVLRWHQLGGPRDAKGSVSLAMLAVGLSRCRRWERGCLCQGGESSPEGSGVGEK